jgi:hypothetical protein
VEPTTASSGNNGSTVSYFYRDTPNPALQHKAVAHSVCTSSSAVVSSCGEKGRGVKPQLRATLLAEFAR